MALGEQIAAAVKEGLAAWKTYIATRQEAYNRKMDKRKERAIQYGEEGFVRMSTVFQYISENIPIPDDKKAGFNRLKELVYRARDRFNKYD